MRNHVLLSKLKQALLLVAGAVMALSPAAPLSVSAASSDSLFTYDMRSAGSSVANSAATNSSANLNLIGDWSSNANGTVFNGDLSSSQSVGYANPSGYTIDVPGSDAVGAAAIISYRGPAPGTCFGDSQNISQIGFFSSNKAQIKLQLSKCRSGNVYPECRIAGLSTPSGNYALRGNEQLQDGNDYRIECVKAPDSGSSATVEMRVTSITESGNTSVKSFTIPDTGSIRSSSSLSVGNKYPLPSQSKNSDQFNGTVKTISYCRGDTLSAAQSCLDEEVSVGPPPAAACSDGIDNDGDGFVDLNDVGCDDSSDDDEYNAPPPVEEAATLQVNLSNSINEQEVNQQSTYNIAIQNVGDITAAGVQAVVTIPANTSVINSGDGAVSGQSVTYDVSAVSGNSTWSSDLTLQLDSGTEGQQVAASLSVIASDNSCSEYSSQCDDTDVDTVIVQPSLIELVTNSSIETDLSGWYGKYGRTSVVSVTRSQEAAHTGTSSIKVEGLSGANNRKSGFTDSPDMVSNTEAGRTYNGSIWVKPQEAGQQIVFRLREWTYGWSLVTDKKLTYTATGTDWVNITNEITAQQNGNHLAFIVYGQDVDAGDYFYVDDLSFTTLP